MGRIQDRTREHLGSSDKAIVAYRRCCARRSSKVEGGQKPMMFLDAGERAQHPGSRHHGRHRPDQRLGSLLDGSRRRPPPRRAWAAPVPNETSATVTRLSAAE